MEKTQHFQLRPERELEKHSIFNQPRVVERELEKHSIFNHTRGKGTGKTQHFQLRPERVLEKQSIFNRDSGKEHSSERELENTAFQSRPRKRSGKALHLALLWRYHVMTYFLKNDRCLVNAKKWKK